MAELLGVVQNTPIPNLLVAAGIVFVFLALVGELTDKVKVPKERQRWMGATGAVLLVAGIGLNLVSPPTSNDDQAASNLPAAATAVQAPQPTAPKLAETLAEPIPTEQPVATTSSTESPASASESQPTTSIEASSTTSTLPGVEVFSLGTAASSIPWLPLDTNARPATYFYVFSSTKAPFDSTPVRQAFALALDRQALTALANSLGDQGRPATTFTPPETLGRDLYGQVGLPFDPARAAELLAQAGYPGGDGLPPLTLGFSADANNEALANAAASMWRANLGVDVQVEQIDEAEYFDRIAGDPPEIFVLGWVADYNDPDGFLFSAFDSESAERVSGFAKPAFDRLVRQAASLAGDPEARQRAYIEAERILTEQEAAIIPLYHFTQAQ